MTSVQEQSPVVGRTIVMSQPAPITLSTCRRALAFTIIMTACCGISACVSHVLSLEIVLGILCVAYTALTIQWVRIYGKVQREGPIVPAPVQSVAITGAGAKAIVAFSYFVLAALTFVSVAWSAMSLMILMQVRFPIVFIGIVTTNILVWWFASSVWKRYLSESRQQCKSVATGIDNVAESNSGRISADSTQAPQSPQGHWWTDTNSRDEIRRVGNR